MATALASYFTDMRQRIQAELEPRIPADRKAIRIPVSFWRDEAKRLLSILLPLVNEGANGGIRQAQRSVERLGISIDWTLGFTRAADWAREHTAELVKLEGERSIIRATQERIRSVVANWIEAPDMTLPDLWKQLEADHGFSRHRAELIAQTETTRAYAEGEIAGAREMEEAGLLTYEKEWQTVMDSKVCQICEPLQGVTVDGFDGEFDTDVGPLQGPPAHPGCRCWINVLPKVA